MVRIQAHDLSFSYEGHSPVLDAFTLDVEPGELVCLLGPSGCGKSTLLRLMAGLLKPQRGELVRSSGRLSFLFQDARLLAWKTVRENVLLPFTLLREKPVDPERVLRQVGLWDARNLFPHQLSGGMKQRTSIARALITSPEVLFMDEPFSALDEGTRHELEELLVKLWNQRRITLVFVTHSVPEAIFIGHRVVVLGPRGRLLLDREVPLGRERSEPLRTSEAFNREVEALSKVVRAARSAP